MASERWDRLMAATGLAFVLLVVISFAVAPFPPKVDDPIGRITRYYARNRTALLAGWYIAGVGTAFGVWFLGVFRGRMAVAEGQPAWLSNVMFGAGVMGFAVAFAGSAAGAALTFHVAGEGNPAVVRAMFDLQNMAFTFYWFPYATSVVAASVLVARTQVLPRWFASYGLVVVACMLIAAAGVMIRTGPFAAGGVVTGGAFGVVTSALYLLWYVGASLLIMRQARAPAMA